MHLGNTVLFPQGNVSHIEHFTSNYITLFIIEKGMLHGYVAYLFYASLLYGVFYSLS